MRESLQRLIWLSLLSLTVSGCTSVSIPDTRVCAIAGIFAAGASCAHTLSDATEQMTSSEFVQFLEPQVDHGPALCESSDDFAKLQIALEQACRKLGSACTKETKQNISQVAGRIGRLQASRKTSKR